MKSVNSVDTYRIRCVWLQVDKVVSSKQGSAAADACSAYIWHVYVCIVRILDTLDAFSL